MLSINSITGDDYILNIKISLLSQIPIYEQLQNQIKELILTGKLQAGEQLPSIRLMAKDLQISVITVKRAYEELEHEGIITSIHGRGCFICEVDIKKEKNINLKILKIQLEDIVKFSKSRGISKDEFQNILDDLYTGGDK